MTNGFVLKSSKSSMCSPVPIKVIGLYVAATLEKERQRKKERERERERKRRREKPRDNYKAKKIAPQVLMPRWSIASCMYA